MLGYMDAIVRGSLTALSCGEKLRKTSGTRVVYTLNYLKTYFKTSNMTEEYVTWENMIQCWESVQP